MDGIERRCPSPSMGFVHILLAKNPLLYYYLLKNIV